MAPCPIAFNDHQLALVLAAGRLLDSGASRAAMLCAFAARLPADPSDKDVVSALAEAMLVSDDMRGVFEAELFGVTHDQHRSRHAI